MAWIESHQQLENHPKVFDLMNDMGWDIDTTIGKLHRFWWWCVDYAEDGDLSKHNDARLSSAVGLNTEEGKQFVEAMVRSCWIDREPYFRVHDWWDYFGKFLQIKYKHNPQSWKKIQRKYINRSKNRSKNHKPNLTKPNQTKPDSRVPACLKKFGEGFKSKIGSPYHADFGKDGQIFKTLLKHFSEEEIACRIDRFFHQEDEFLKKAGYTVGVFKTRFNSLAGKEKDVKLPSWVEQ